MPEMIKERNVSQTDMLTDFTLVSKFYLIFFNLLNMVHFNILNHIRTIRLVNFSY